MFLMSLRMGQVLKLSLSFGPLSAAWRIAVVTAASATPITAAAATAIVAVVMTLMVL